MKKIIYAIAISISSLIATNLYSQTEYKCYSLEKNKDGVAEMVLVKLIVEGNKVDADYTKDMVGNGDNMHVTMKRQGTIEGDKIVFTPAAETKADDAQTNKNDSWYFKNGTLIVGDDILKPGGCN